MFTVSDGNGLKDVECWPQLQDAMIEAVARLERALGPCIKTLQPLPEDAVEASSLDDRDRGV